MDAWHVVGMHPGGARLHNRSDDGFDGFVDSRWGVEKGDAGGINGRSGVVVMTEQT